MFAVSVLVIDCTTIGAPPPIANAADERDRGCGGGVIGESIERTPSGFEVRARWRVAVRDCAKVARSACPQTAASTRRANGAARGRARHDTAQHSISDRRKATRRIAQFTSTRTICSVTQPSLPAATSIRQQRLQRTSSSARRDRARLRARVLVAWRRRAGRPRRSAIDDPLGVGSTISRRRRRSCRGRCAPARSAPAMLPEG